MSTNLKADKGLVGAEAQMGRRQRNGMCRGCDKREHGTV